MENIKIPEEMAQKIREESAMLGKKYASRAQEYDAYTQFVESQIQFFQEDVKKILDVLGKLIMEGKLYIHTRLLARVKDPESALHNDDIKKMDKNVLMDEILNRITPSDYEVLETNYESEKKNKSKKLDDVFGVTIITDTEDELEVLREELRENFIIHKEKKKEKAQYHAIHMEMFGKIENEQSPLIECQLKTRQHYIDSYDHTLYKVETNIARRLNEAKEIRDNQKVKLNAEGIKKVEETIQSYYDNGKFNIFTNIPRMWEATFSEENEEMKIRRLTEGQTLKRVYPSLVIRSEKSR